MFRGPTVYVIDEGLIEESINVGQASLAGELDVPHSPPASNLTDHSNIPTIEREWRGIIDAQKRLARHDKAFCCFGCVSPELLLSTLTLFWVLIAFYEGLRDYDVKHFEAISVYLLSFCIFAAMVSAQRRLFIVAFAACFLELMWNKILLFLLVKIKYEIEEISDHMDDERTPASLYLSTRWMDLYSYILRMIYEDYYSYAFVYILKVIFIYIVILTAFEVLIVQSIEDELRLRRKRIGNLMNESRERFFSMPSDFTRELHEPGLNTAPERFVSNGEFLRQPSSLVTITATAGSDMTIHSTSSLLLTAVEGEFTTNSCHNEGKIKHSSSC